MSVDGHHVEGATEELEMGENRDEKNKEKCAIVDNRAKKNE